MNRSAGFLWALALGCLLGLDAARAESPSCRTPLVGPDTLDWHPSRQAAQRQARRDWALAVKGSPVLGERFAQWDWARHPDGFGGGDGFFCRTRRVLGEPWHKCAAWGQPCDGPAADRRDPLPVAALSSERADRRLEIRDAELEITRLTPQGACPAGFLLSARVIAVGHRGLVRVSLRDSDGRVQSTTLRAHDFRPAEWSGRVATVDFKRELHGSADRVYWLSVASIALGSGGQPRLSDVGPVRDNARQRLVVDCRNASADKGRHPSPDLRG